MMTTAPRQTYSARNIKGEMYSVGSAYLSGAFRLDWLGVAHGPVTVDQCGGLKKGHGPHRPPVGTSSRARKKGQAFAPSLVGDPLSGSANRYATMTHLRQLTKLVGKSAVL
jgi:hypothetical protein